MKFITERTEIGRKINLEHVPVLTVDLDGDACVDYEGCYKGSRVNIVGVYGDRYRDMYCECRVGLWGDRPGNENHDKPWTYREITLDSGRCTCLHADFGLHDVIESVEWSNARVVKPGDKVLLFFVSKRRGIGCLREMRVGDRVNPHCMTVTKLHDIDE